MIAGYDGRRVYAIGSVIKRDEPVRQGWEIFKTKRFNPKFARLEKEVVLNANWTILIAFGLAPRNVSDAEGTDKHENRYRCFG